jgi:hypothetical protein
MNCIESGRTNNPTPYDLINYEQFVNSQATRKRNIRELSFLNFHENLVGRQRRQSWLHHVKPLHLIGVLTQFWAPKGARDPVSR